MEIGTKIIATNSEYTSVPKGTIMTVVHDLGYGQVEATVDGGGMITWYMENGDFEEYTPLRYGHVTLPDGRTVDLTANRVRCDLMDPDELQAMKDHGGPYEAWSGAWHEVDPGWLNIITYRVTPKPVRETEVWYWRYDAGFFEVQKSFSTHKITLTIQDGKIIDTKTEEL